MASTSDASAIKNEPDTKAAKNGPGTISDALTAFEAQATKLPAEPVPDAYVAIAYALGWAVGDALICASYQVFDHLVKVPELEAPADQWKLLVHQILSRCSHLNNHLKSTKADLNLKAELKTAANLLLDSPPGDVKMAVGAKRETAMELHTGILAVLWSVASPLAKSYQLGHEMEQMCATPVAESSTTVSASVKAHDAELHRLLTALASKLPANAAHATDNSLRLWSASLGAGGAESAEDLLLQGRRWHEVLAGEVSGKDGLRLTDYVAAADSVAGKLWQTARQVAARFKVWLIVAVVFALGGIGLIIWGASGAIGAGIATLLATFGLTWKGIGEFFGRVAAKGEEQLWDAEIDWAIAYRFTILKNPPADHQLKPRSKALNMDQPTKEHLRRYTQWKNNWPDVLTGASANSYAARQAEMFDTKTDKGET
jgi:hypothetical protein